jgi:hypothetical protein
MLKYYEEHVKFQPKHSPRMLSTNFIAIITLRKFEKTSIKKRHTVVINRCPQMGASLTTRREPTPNQTPPSTTPLPYQPTGLYPTCSWDVKVLKRLIQSKKLAPISPGRYIGLLISGAKQSQRGL